MKIGFIGLGSMGAPIARRLARCGFDVIGCDLAPEMLQAFDEPGTTRSSDPIETAGLAELLGICVRTDEQLANLVDGGRLFEALGEGGLVILHSTVAPNLARELAALATKYKVGFVDAGVSGGAPAAIEGQLTLFVGGEVAEVERAKPWFEAIGKSMAHLGPVGRGQEAKLLIQRRCRRCWPPARRCLPVSGGRQWKQRKARQGRRVLRRMRAGI